MNTAVTPKASPVTQQGLTAPIAPKKGPPPLPPDSTPDVGARHAEPMRPRFETAPGVGHVAETPRAPATLSLSREDVDAMIRKGVQDGVAAVLGEAQRLLGETQRHVHALERRIDDLERRPVPVGAAVAPAPPIVAAMAAHAARAPAAYAPVSAIPVSYGPAPVLDVRAIELDKSISVDSALDGSRRKRNLVIVITILILAVFGGLFAMLAQSYSPHP